MHLPVGPCSTGAPREVTAPMSIEASGTDPFSPCWYWCATAAGAVSNCTWWMDSQNKRKTPNSWYEWGLSHWITDLCLQWVELFTQSCDFTAVEAICKKKIHMLLYLALLVKCIKMKQFVLKAKLRFTILTRCWRSCACRRAPQSRRFPYSLLSYQLVPYIWKRR